MNGEVNRAVAQRAKAGWLRRNSAVIPRPALAGLRGASLARPDDYFTEDPFSLNLNQSDNFLFGFILFSHSSSQTVNVVKSNGL